MKRPGLAIILALALARPAWAFDAKSGAAAALSVTAPLSGAGTAGSPLTITSPLPIANGGSGAAGGGPLGSFGCETHAAGAVNTINQTRLLGFNCALATLVTGKVQYQVSTADNSANLYDIGVYSCGLNPSGTGTLLFDTGAFAGSAQIAATGNKNTALITNAGCTAAGQPSSCCTGNTTGTCPTYPLNVSPGYCMFAVTANTATGVLDACAGSSDWSWMTPISAGGASVNGVLPATVTCPGITVNVSAGRPDFMAY